MGRRKEDDGVPFEGALVVRATDKALLVRLGEEYQHKELWVPKSVVHDDSEVNDVGEEGILVLATWYVEKEEIL